MKNKTLFSLKDKSEKLKCRLLHFLFGVFRVNLVKTLKISETTARGSKYVIFIIASLLNG